MNNIRRNYLRHCRKVLGLTQEDFAKLIGVDPTTISKQESSDRMPSLEEAIAIEMVCGESIRDIFSEDYLDVKHDTKDRARDLLAEFRSKPHSLENDHKMKMTELIAERI